MVSDVGLCMIVKDEAHVIARCLGSVRPFVNHWVVVDTGSTDGTGELVRELLAGIPGMVVEQPWVDFGTNRSQALAAARTHAAYTMMIDADETFEAFLEEYWTKSAVSAVASAPRSA